MNMTENRIPLALEDVWSFIRDVEKVRFPTDIKKSWTLIMEFVPSTQLFCQYRLYLDQYGNKKYAFVSLRE